MNRKIINFAAGGGQILAALIWGFAFVVVKDSLDHIGPVWMVAFRFTIAAVCLSFVYIKKLKNLSKNTLIHGAVLGLYLGLAYIFQTIGCNYTTAGKNAFLTTLYVILIPFFSWILNKKRPEWYVFLCAVMSMVGIGLLALGTDDSGVVNKGDVLTLICGIFYAVHIIFTSKYNQTEDPVLLTVLQFAFAAVLGWITAPFADGKFPAENLLQPNVIIAMLYLGIFSTLVAFVLQNVGLKFLPPALSSLLLSFESVFGVLFGALILHEMLTPRMFIGCALIFVSVVLAQVLPDLQRKKDEE